MCLKKIFCHLIFSIPVAVLAFLFLEIPEVSAQTYTDRLYQCRYCYSSLYSPSMPSEEDASCTSEVSYNHSWILLGIYGEKQYQCTKCGLLVGTTAQPGAGVCIQGGSHAWNDLGKLGENQYLCKYCKTYVSLKSRPDKKGCPYAGKHEWCNLGRVGDRLYRCHYCGFEVYTNSKPSRDNCPSAPRHSWIWENPDDDTTIYISPYTIIGGGGLYIGCDENGFTYPPSRPPRPRPDGPPPHQRPDGDHHYQWPHKPRPGSGMINRPDKEGGSSIQKPGQDRPSVVFPNQDSSSDSGNTNNRPKPPPLGGIILPGKDNATNVQPSQKRSHYSSDNNRIKRPRSKLQDTFL